MSAEPMTPDEALRVLSEQPGAMVPGTERSRALEVVVTVLDEARAELARRDTTIAAVRDLHQPDEKMATFGLQQCRGCATSVTFTPWPCPTMAALSAPVEAGATEPAPDALAAHASISLDRPDGPNGSVDATCKCGAWATVLNDAEARAWWDEHKAGASAEPTSDTTDGLRTVLAAISRDVQVWRTGRPSEASYRAALIRIGNRLSAAGVEPPADGPAEPTSDTERPGICPTCESSQPHLHPHPGLCPDAWHKPVPTTIDGWRRETERWASLLHQIAEHGSSIPDVRRSVDLLADDMQRALTGAADTAREDQP